MICISSSISWTVSTAVGSSKIRISLSLYSIFKISVLCCISNRDIFNNGIRIDLKMIPFQTVPSLFFLASLFSESSLDRLSSENNVVQYGEAFHQLEMLMYHSDSQCIGIIRVFDFYFFPIFSDFTFFRLIKSEQNAHEGGFSRTILPKERMNLTFFSAAG